MFTAEIQFWVYGQNKAVRRWQTDSPQSVESNFMDWIRSIRAEMLPVSEGDTNTRWIANDTAFPALQYRLIISL